MPAADVYSLHCSAEAVIRFLERVDPQHAKAARQRYACFDKCATYLSARSMFDLLAEALLFRVWFVICFGRMGGESRQAHGCSACKACILCLWFSTWNSHRLLCNNWCTMICGRLLVKTGSVALRSSLWLLVNCW